MKTKQTAPKKTVKKATAASAAAAKKTTKKTTKKTALQPLVYAHESTTFWVSDGQILNSLVALEIALAEMKNATYTYHVSLDKNDLADWVEVVLGDASCANDLRKAKTKASAKSAVTKNLKRYQR